MSIYLQYAGTVLHLFVMRDWGSILVKDGDRKCEERTFKEMTAESRILLWASRSRVAQVVGDAILEQRRLGSTRDERRT